MLNKPFVIIITGPTACGKSNLAIQLKKYLPIELVSVDSALIYRDMNIGTAKPSIKELSLVSHHLIDIKDPIERYSVAEFRADALLTIKQIITKRKIPLLVGGTMLYFKVLLEGLSMLPSSNLEFRNSILNYFLTKKNLDKLHDMLKDVDPMSSVRIHKNDIQRILRALEVFFLSGTTLTDLMKNRSSIFPYTVFQFSIMPPNKMWLHNIIETRFHSMLIDGFEEEVKKLFIRGDLNINLPSMRCIGYRQMWQYLSNNLSYQDMVKQSIFATKQLAKRQMTWLKNWKDLCILNYNENINILTDQILKKINF